MHAVLGVRRGPKDGTCGALILGGMHLGITRAIINLPKDEDIPASIHGDAAPGTAGAMMRLPDKRAAAAVVLNGGHAYTGSAGDIRVASGINGDGIGPVVRLAEL